MRGTWIALDSNHSLDSYTVFSDDTRIFIIITSVREIRKNRTVIL